MSAIDTSEAATTTPPVLTQPARPDLAHLTGGQAPSLGRMVHFTSRGSLDGEYLPEQRMAWITELSPMDGHVSLFVVTPNGTFHDQDVPYADKPTPGCWNWPTYV